MKTYFVSSDIHGFYTKWRNELRKQGFDKTNPDHIIILCGDLFDRGREAKKIINFLLSLPPERRILIRGNHEDLFMDIFKTGDICVSDITNGTAGTIEDLTGGEYDFFKLALMSVNDVKRLKTKLIPTGIFDIINSMVNYYELGDYIFVHGYLPIENNKIVTNWKHATKKQWNESRWINGMDKFLNCDAVIENKTIVCGHYHTSYGHICTDPKYTDGHNYLHEFPHKTDKGRLLKKDKALFKPFVYTKGNATIIALDACTKYTNMVNVYKIEL